MRWWDQRLSGPIYCRMAASFRILTQSAIGRDLCKMGDAGGTPAYSQAMPNPAFLGLLITGVPLCPRSQWHTQGHPFYAAHFPLSSEYQNPRKLGYEDQLAICAHRQQSCPLSLLAQD